MTARYYVQAVYQAPYMCPAFRFDKRMDLINDNKFKVFQIRGQVTFKEEHFERLGRDHEVMGRFSRRPCPISPRNIAMPFLDFKTARGGEREKS